MPSTFVLVHGHWHGAWAWDVLAPALVRRGHVVRAVQLPSDRLECGAAANAEAIIDAARDLPDDAIFVGHSAGGLSIPIVARRRPVGGLVFVAAILAQPGMSLLGQVAVEPDLAVPGFTWIERADGLLDIDSAVARRAFFHDCDAATADAAVKQLRLQTERTIIEITPLDEWPDVPCAAITCRRDRVVGPEWQRRAAIERLRVEPIELDSGHSPALSHPRELADALELAVERIVRARSWPAAASASSA
ncbi:MAG TPA: alpha/beta fold hydrolase [Conexibacter sp.]|nr:alpha/beta fold hydrolase [Conexibacter sp.]